MLGCSASFFSQTAGIQKLAAWHMDRSSKQYNALSGPYDVHNELATFGTPKRLDAMPIDHIAREIHGIEVHFNGYNTVSHRFRTAGLAYLRSTKLLKSNPNDVKSAGTRYSTDEDSMSEETWNWSVEQWRDFFFNGSNGGDPVIGTRYRLPILTILDRNTLKGFQYGSGVAARSCRLSPA